MRDGEVGVELAVSEVVRGEACGAGPEAKAEPGAGGDLGGT